MRLFKKEFRLSLAWALPALLVVGCVSIAPIEPVKNPPLKFRSNATVLVEFVHPTKVGLRCGQRGATAHGIPIAMACADSGLVTIPNPCVTVTGGSYAEVMCHQKRRSKKKESNEALFNLASIDPRLRPRSISQATEKSHKFIVEFVRPEEVERKCSARGLEVYTDAAGDLSTCGTESLITVSNPCLNMAKGWYARTMCHELGHVNGWSVNHRGGSYKSDRALGIDTNNIPPPIHIVDIMRSKNVPPPASASPTYLAYKAANKQFVAVSAEKEDDLSSRFLVSLPEPDFGPKLRGRLSDYYLLHNEFY